MSEEAAKSGLQLVLLLMSKLIDVIDDHTTGGKLKMAKDGMAEIASTVSQYSDVLTAEEKSTISDFVEK